MPASEPTIFAGWAFFAIGLYSLCAAILELRRPGAWAAMIDGLRSNGALAYVTGMLLLAIGIAITAAHRGGGDWRDLVTTFFGWAMMVEGAIFIAAPDLMLALSRKMLGGRNRLWAIVSLIIGAAALAVAAPILIA